MANMNERTISKFVNFWNFDSFENPIVNFTNWRISKIGPFSKLIIYGNLVNG